MQTPKTYGDFNQYDHETVDLWVFVFWMHISFVDKAIWMMMGIPAFMG